MKFTIFKNKTKKNPKEPDYRILGEGFVKIGACWLKESKKSGEKFFSCEIEDKLPQGYQGTPEPAEEEGNKFDYPF
jgi:uncharacterized protein (DUF736 family)